MLGEGVQQPECNHSLSHENTEKGSIANPILMGNEF